MKSRAAFIIVFSFIVFSVSCKNDNAITVYGFGELTFMPNMLNVRIDINNIDMNLISSMDKTRNTLTGLKNLCNAYSIMDDNIKTTNINTGKRYKQNNRNTGENEFIGFESSITIIITIHDLSTFEEFSSKLLHFDDLSIRSSLFTHSDLKQYNSELNLLALDDAKLSAQTMAEHMGYKLGETAKIAQPESRDPFGNWYYDIEATGRSTGGIPVSPGIMTMKKVLEVQFELKK
ncbi:MAG: SIMPL domain-containing protein [Treponema sp.]|jgi:uncharacterized protein YggE|nr:SIMPL domain-containing protein [Treponema sp.]